MHLIVLTVEPGVVVATSTNEVRYWCEQMLLIGSNVVVGAG